MSSGHGLTADALYSDILPDCTVADVNKPIHSEPNIHRVTYIHAVLTTFRVCLCQRDKLHRSVRTVVGLLLSLAR